MRKLPKIDMTSDFQMIMKFYWAREDQTKKEDERAWTGGPFTKIVGANGLHPIFLDYDWADYNKTMANVRLLQARWRLGNAYVYASVNTSFHVMCYYDWVPYKQFVKILESDPRQDPGYTAIVKKQRGGVLRTCAKPGKQIPKYVCTLKSPYQKEKTQVELDWGDRLKLSVEALLGMPLIWIKDFRKGALLRKKSRGGV